MTIYNANQNSNSRQQILEAANTACCRGRYVEMTMKELAITAKVSRATLYRYYSTKDELLMDLIEENSQSLKYKLWALLVDGKTVGERVELIIKTSLSVMTDTPASGYYLALMVVARRSDDVNAIVDCIMSQGVGDLKLAGRLFIEASLRNALLSTFVRVYSQFPDMPAQQEELIKLVAWQLQMVWDEA